MNPAERLRSLALADARRLLETHLFDARHYVRQAGLAPDADAFAHFFLEGGMAGLGPNHMFDARWYLQQNPDVAEAGVNPLLHYAVVGEPAGLDPSPLFDVAWYRDAYATPTPLAHYLSHRFGPFSPIPEFDAAYYLQTNPDLAEAGFDPFQHYMQFGYREFRKPSADFNPRLYANRRLAHDRAANPVADLRARRRAGDRHVEAHRPATSFERVKQYARAGARYEPLAPAPTEAAPRALALAFYLTQYHRIPENDAWWGEGFTEWSQLARGQPRFAGHYQPRIPGALGFYDLSRVETMRQQARLARSAGLSGFVFYYYDFDGRRLLETPLENFLKAPDIDIGFCLMWANENWTRRWDGADEDVLIAQSYDPGHEPRRVAEFARHFRDPRYVRLDGRPLLMIYRASLIPDTAATVQRWRRLFKDQHQEEPLFVMAQCFDDVDPRPLGFDAAVEFPPHKLTKGLPDIYNQLDIFDEAFEAHAFAYDDLVEASLAEGRPDFPLIKTAVPSWDNDARRQGQGLTLVGATPLKYERWLAELVAAARPWMRQALVCVNAWNEWSEGAYLEPDVHFGWAYLNATARALRGAPRGRAQLLAIGRPGTAALTAITRRFRAGFGFEVKALEAGAAIPPGALAAIVAGDAASALTACAAAGLSTILALDRAETADAQSLYRADVVAFADEAARQRSFAALPKPAPRRSFAALDALAAESAEGEAEARALFDLALPDVAKVAAFVVNQGAAFAGRRLASVFGQIHPVAEVFILDQSSTEASFAAIDVAARAADRDAVVVLEDSPGGLGFALRRAAEITTGEFVWVAGAAGVSEPEFLSRMTAALQADPRVALAFCNSRALAQSGEPVRAPPSLLDAEERRTSFVDQTFEAVDFARSFRPDKNPIADIGAALWRRDALKRALAAVEPAASGDWLAVLRALTALPKVRIAHVAEDLDFTLADPTAEALARKPQAARRKLDWDVDRAAVVGEIAGRPADLKIVLKVKDEALHLQSWWEWHAAVYGAENLIVFDNQSTLPETLAILETIGQQCPVVRFSGHCDRLHETSALRDLYQALRASSRYFTFLDADERLCFVEEGRIVGEPPAIRKKISTLSSDVLLCPWLEAVLGQERTFHIAHPLDHLHWGKPILASRRPHAGYVNHNAQYLKINLDASVGGGAFVAHMRRQWPQERIRTNIAKLIGLFGFASEREIRAFAADAEKRAAAPPAVEVYLQEILWLDAAPVPQGDAAWYEGCLRLDAAHRLEFHDEATRRAFADMLDPRSALFQKFLAAPLGETNAD